MPIVIAAAGWLLAQAAAAPAPQAAPVAAAAPAPDAKPEKPKKPKLICTEETPVGSVIAKRTCRTPEQIEADRVASRRSTDLLLDHLATCSAASC